MKHGLSGSIVNELEVSERWEEMQTQARALLSKLKEKEKRCPKKLLREDCHTVVSDGYFELMIRRTKKRLY